MHCPACGSEDTKVVDSRPTSGGFGVRRRRECERCQNRFSTIEEMELLGLSVIKRDGHKEPYSNAKLQAGLRKSLEKRPCTEEQFRELVHAIEREIQSFRKEQILASQIGEIVISHLRRFDPVAYIRFASVYRSFGDLAEFRKELDTFKAKNKD